MSAKRQGIRHFKVAAVYPLNPKLPRAKTQIDTKTLETVGLKLNKRQAWEMIKGLGRFLISDTTHVELTGDRKSNLVRISSRVEKSNV